MFNGIIKNTGRVSKIYKNNNNCFIEISSKMKFKKNEIGSSISCSGVCLTVEKFNKNLVKFYVSKETLNKTIFKSSKKGAIINLEKPLRYGNLISGHFIQGHVDTTCTHRQYARSSMTRTRVSSVTVVSPSSTSRTHGPMVRVSTSSR